MESRCRLCIVTSILGTSPHHFELILEIVLFFEKKVQVRNKGERYNQVI